MEYEQQNSKKRKMSGLERAIATIVFVGTCTLGTVGCTDVVVNDNDNKSVLRDVDGDNKPDIVFAVKKHFDYNGSEPTYVFYRRNLGNGEFSEQPKFLYKANTTPEKLPVEYVEYMDDTNNIRESAYLKELIYKVEHSRSQLKK